MFKVGDKVRRICGFDTKGWLTFKTRMGKSNEDYFTVTATSHLCSFIGIDGYEIRGDISPFNACNFTLVNPEVSGIKADQGKPRLGLVLVEVPHAFEKLGTLLGFGADKYSVGNWDKVPEGEMRYLDALMRHLTQHHRGEKVDPESGELHLAHAAVNIMFLLDKELRK